MSNTSSATSMRRDNAQRMRLSWRKLFALLLIIAAMVFTAVTLPPLRHARQTERRQHALLVAGAIAEELEMGWFAHDDAGLQDWQRQALSSLLIDPSVARIRLWSGQQQLLAEASRADTSSSTSDTRPAPEVEEAIRTVLERVTQPEVNGRVLGLREVMVDQREVSLLLAEVRDADQVTAQQRDKLYVLQDAALNMAEVLPDGLAYIGAARQAMSTVLELITVADVGALARAEGASQEAEAYLSLALESRRSLTDEAAMPAALARYAPTSAVIRRTPLVRGYRVVVPLLTAGKSAMLEMPLGAAEVLLYDCPAAALARPLFPAGGMALLALLLLLWPRRRKSRHDRQERTVFRE
jgi:hypothetical protein